MWTCVTSRARRFVQRQPSGLLCPLLCIEQVFDETEQQLQTGCQLANQRNQIVRGNQGLFVEMTPDLLLHLVTLRGFSPVPNIGSSAFITLLS
jgi:hypothetical protein